MRTLLIDNYDSFTYNLFQLLAEANGDEPIVVHNDAADWAELEHLEFDNIVISPGPGSPDHDGDFGVSTEAIEKSRVPLLGVCLGHQGLCWVHGGKVVRAPEVMHGRLSAVLHDGSPLFAKIPREFQAVRYHSLCVEQPIPEDMEAIARTSDGIVMALAHRTRPQWGVQFHPESICTEYGRQLLSNFRDLTRELEPARGNGGRPAAPTAPPKRRGVAGRGKLAMQVQAPGQTARHRAGVRQPLRRERERLLAGQQQDRRARPLLVHGSGRRTARRGDLLRRQQRRAADRPRRRDGGAERIDLRLPQRRDAAPALPLRRPAVRFQLRVRRLLRLRVEGRMRGQRRPPLDDARRALLLRPADDRVRPPGAVHLRAVRRLGRRDGGGGALDRRDEPAARIPLAGARRAVGRDAAARAGLLPPEPLARAVSR